MTVSYTTRSPFFHEPRNGLANECTEDLVEDYIDYVSSRGPMFLHKDLIAPSHRELTQIISGNLKNAIVGQLGSLRGCYQVGEQPDGQQFTLQWESSVEDLVDDRAATKGFIWASNDQSEHTIADLGRWVYALWNQKRLNDWGMTRENLVDWLGHNCHSFQSYERAEGSDVTKFTDTDEV